MIKSFLSSRLAISIITLVVLGIYTTLIYNHGASTMKDKLLLKYNQMVSEKEDAILKLKNDLAQERQAGITASELLTKQYQERINEQQEKYESAIDGLESDNFRLRVNIGEGDPIETGTAISTTPQSCDDGNRTTYLPTETSRFLIREATAANGVVEKLTACQNTVKLYLELVDKYNRSITGEVNEG